MLSASRAAAARRRCRQVDLAPTGRTAEEVALQLGGPPGSTARLKLRRAGFFGIESDFGAARALASRERSRPQEPGWRGGR
jgi:hypothetical protein